MSVFGPIFFGESLTRTGNPSWAIVSLLPLFVIGWAIVVPLDIARGQREAEQDLAVSP